jgi:hypothetical protein
MSEQTLQPIALGMTFKHTNKIYRCVYVAPHGARVYCVPAEASAKTREDGTEVYSDYGSIDLSAESFVEPCAAPVSTPGVPFGGFRKKGLPFAETALGVMLAEKPRTLGELAQELMRSKASVYSSLWTAKKAGLVVEEKGKFTVAVADPLGAK